MEIEDAMDTEPVIPLSIPSSTSSSSSSSSPSNSLLESLKFEHQLVKLPFEQLKKSLRVASRAVEKEVNAVVAGVAEAVHSPDDPLPRLAMFASRLRGLKRKLEDINREEGVQLQKCQSRLDHLNMAKTDDKELLVQWKRMRLDRILVDYMLRSSYYATATKLSEASMIKDLTDNDIFSEAQVVIEALQHKDCSIALDWCYENRQRLKKFKSTLEFKLRIQEFIELVRKEKMVDAILYARKYLASWGGTHMKDLQHVMATLAFKSNTECPSYKVLFDNRQWDDLVKLFKEEFSRLYGITVEPSLHIHLQAGLCALKTSICNEEGCTTNDPLSQEAMKQLAEPLPYALHVHSKIICFISKELINEENPPLVFPNGFVYGRKALEEMARRNGGNVTCPRTGLVCSLNDLAKAYIS